MEKKSLKILNLCSGIGGNRKEWGSKHEITAVEFDPDIKAMYEELYPNDEVIHEDAFEYLRNHFEEFDFIWISPLCTYSTRLVIANYGRYGNIPQIPNLDEIYGTQVFLNKFYKGLYVVENVKPWYPVLIEPEVSLGRHLFWSNFSIPSKEFKYERCSIDKMKIQDLADFKGIDLAWLKSHKIKNWTKNHSPYRTIMRNCVDSRIGKHILENVETVFEQRRY